MTHSGLKSYLVCLPRRLRRGALTFVISYGILLLTAIYQGFDYKTTPFWLACLPLAILVFFSPFWKALSERRSSLQRLEERGLLEAALADFETAVDFPKLCRIGQRFVFGFDSGVVAEIAQIQRVYTDSYRSLRHSDGSSGRETLYARLVLCTGEEKILCLATGSHSATTLLRERIEALRSTPD